MVCLIVLIAAVKVFEFVGEFARCVVCHIVLRSSAVRLDRYSKLEHYSKLNLSL